MEHSVVDGRLIIASLTPQGRRALSARFDPDSRSSAEDAMSIECSMGYVFAKIAKLKGLFVESVKMHQCSVAYKRIIRPGLKPFNTLDHLDSCLEAAPTLDVQEDCSLFFLPHEGDGPKESMDVTVSSVCQLRNFSKSDSRDVVPASRDRSLATCGMYCGLLYCNTLDSMERSVSGGTLDHVTENSTAIVIFRSPSNPVTAVSCRQAFFANQIILRASLTGGQFFIYVQEDSTPFISFGSGHLKYQFIDQKSASLGLTCFSKRLSGPPELTAIQSSCFKMQLNDSKRSPAGLLPTNNTHTGHAKGADLHLHEYAKPLKPGHGLAFEVFTSKTEGSDLKFLKTCIAYSIALSRSQFFGSGPDQGGYGKSTRGQKSGRKENSSRQHHNGRREDDESSEESDRRRSSRRAGGRDDSERDSDESTDGDTTSSSDTEPENDESTDSDSDASSGSKSSDDVSIIATSHAAPGRSLIGWLSGKGAKENRDCRHSSRARRRANSIDTDVSECESSIFNATESSNDESDHSHIPPEKEREDGSGGNYSKFKTRQRPTDRFGFDWLSKKILPDVGESESESEGATNSSSSWSRRAARNAGAPFRHSKRDNGDDSESSPELERSVRKSRPTREPFHDSSSGSESYDGDSESEASERVGRTRRSESQMHRTTGTDSKKKGMLSWFTGRKAQGNQSRDHGNRRRSSWLSTSSSSDIEAEPRRESLRLQRRRRREYSSGSGSNHRTIFSWFGGGNKNQNSSPARRSNHFRLPVASRSERGGSTRSRRAR